MDARWRFRLATRADAPALAALERAVFPDPWSEDAFREAAAGPWSFVLLAEDDEGLAGYFVGREVAGSGEVLDLAVRADARRHGLGRTLLTRGLEQLVRRGATEAYLEVRESNTAAQALYGAFGFEPAGRREGYYRSPAEDALVLRCPLH